MWINKPGRNYISPILDLDLLTKTLTKKEHNSDSLENRKSLALENGSIVIAVPLHHNTKAIIFIIS